MKIIKKILLSLLIILCLASPVYATNYYACQAAQNLTGDATWCTAAQVSGSCAATAARTAWATVTADSPTLYANGCTVVINDSFTAVALSTADGDGAGAAVAGGGFTLATGTVSGKTFTTAVAAGSTPCVVISGNGAGTPVDTFVGAITGGASTNAHGISTTHTVGTIQITGNVGNGAGTPNYGAFLNSAGLITITGNCTGTATAQSGAGCYGASTGTITITGKIIHGTRTAGAQGAIIFTPGVTDYVLYPKDTSYSIGTVNAYATEMPTDPTAAKVLLDTHYGSYTGSMAPGGGSYGY